jgi:hypothetical protein
MLGIRMRLEMDIFCMILIFGSKLGYKSLQETRIYCKNPSFFIYECATSGFSFETAAF